MNELLRPAAQSIGSADPAARYQVFECVERVSGSGQAAVLHQSLEVEYDFVVVRGRLKHKVGPMIGEAMDSGDKSANKAMAIAYTSMSASRRSASQLKQLEDPDAHSA
jgi:hypothetical protein